VTGAGVQSQPSPERKFHKNKFLFARKEKI